MPLLLDHWYCRLNGRTMLNWCRTHSYRQAEQERSHQQDHRPSLGNAEGMDMSKSNQVLDLDNGCQVPSSAYVQEDDACPQNAKAASCGSTTEASSEAADLLFKRPSQGTENDSLGLDQRAIMQELAASR